MSIKTLFLGLAICGILFALTGCSTEAEGTEHFLTGIVYDYYSAVGVQNATVTFGDTTVLTGVDGRFSISLGASGGLASGDFTIHKSGYYPYFYDNSSVDSSGDCEISYPLFRSSGYVDKTLSGHIYYHDGSTELSAGTSYSISIRNERGQEIDFESGGYPGPEGYSMLTQVQGQNCIIYVKIKNADNDCTHFCMALDNDLSVAAPEIDFVLGDPAEDVLITDLTVNADNFGASYYGAMAYFSQNRLLPVIRKESGFYPDLELDFSVSSSNTVDIVDLFPGSQLYMIQVGKSTATGHENQLMSTGLINTPTSSSSINLPALVENGPAEIPDQTTISYLAGTVRVDAVDLANLYIFVFVDEGTGLDICTVTSTENSISLPAWLRTMLAGKTVTIKAAVASQTNYMRIEKFNYMIMYGFYAMPGHIESGVSGSYEKVNVVIP
ncbi:MAG: hypothetical protein EHM28_05895 [Spirochaetaceae bacterium]|nr:MAG: hypothetical protein EHM28_05895 [Spirochaetaceae bacterium]